jgi:hypothetical protein
MANLWSEQWEDDGYDGDYLNEDEKASRREIDRIRRKDEDTEEWYYGD